MLDLIDTKQERWRLNAIIDLLFNAGLIDHRHAVLCLQGDLDAESLDDEAFAEQFGTTPEEYNRLMAKS